MLRKQSVAPSLRSWPEAHDNGLTECVGNSRMVEKLTSMSLFFTASLTSNQDSSRLSTKIYVRVSERSRADRFLNCMKWLAS